MAIGTCKVSYNYYYNLSLMAALTTNIVKHPTIKDWPVILVTSIGTKC